MVAHHVHAGSHLACFPFYNGVISYIFSHLWRGLEETWKNSLEVTMRLCRYRQNIVLLLTDMETLSTTNSSSPLPISRKIWKLWEILCLEPGHSGTPYGTPYSLPCPGQCLATCCYGNPVKLFSPKQTAPSYHLWICMEIIGLWVNPAMPWTMACYSLAWKLFETLLSRNKQFFPSSHLRKNMETLENVVLRTGRLET